MRPQDLTTGHVCLHADGRYSMVMKNTCEHYANSNSGNLIFKSNDRIGIKNFNSDFTWCNNTTKREKSIAVVKVYKPRNLCNSINVFEPSGFKHSNFTLVWSKPELVQEMTMEQICQALGKQIKIVK